MLFAPRKPKTTVFTTFFLASGSKNHGIYTVFVPVPSKSTLIYAVFTMLQDVVPICEKDKSTEFYDILASRAQQKSVKQLLKNGPKSISKSIL